MVESMSTKGLVAFYRAASGDLQFFLLSECSSRRPIKRPLVIQIKPTAQIIITNILKMRNFHKTKTPPIEVGGDWMNFP